MSLADVLVPWLIFGTSVAVICVRLLRSRRKSGHYTGWRFPPPAEQWPADPRAPDQAAEPAAGPSAASHWSSTARTAGRRDEEEREDGDEDSEPGDALGQQAPSARG